VARATPRPVRGAYLIHTGYELPLLLEGRKKLAVFSDAYPPDEHWNERYFTPYVEKGVIHREIDIEPFDPPSVRKDGTRFDGMRTVLHAQRRGVAHPCLQACVAGRAQIALERAL
jgi:hypothetical protein